MNGRRAALAVLALGLVGSQAGHVVAYELRFGDAAQAIQSSGAHAYFPALAKTVIGAAALALLAGLLIVGFARVIAGRLEKESAPSFIRLLAALYTLQLALFAGQETVEALLNGAPASSVAALLLWGTVGQLPVAVAGALALRWLLARLGPALAHLHSSYGRAFQLLPYTAALIVFPVAAEMVPALDGLGNRANPRGPPSSF